MRDRRLRSRLNRLFAGVVLLTCLVHSLTCTRSPPAWQDEVQIIDYGRTMFPGSDQSYGVNWSDRNRPVRLLSSIGPLVQETACRMSSNTIVGPRIAALLGAAVAAYAMRGWLVAAGVSPWIALVATWAFLWDPLFASSYRSARVDSWCMAALMGSLWCVRLASRRGAGDRMLVAAGAAVAVSGFVWPSASLLTPLLAYEILGACRRPPGDSPTGACGFPWRHILRQSLVVAASAMVFTMLLVAPLWGSVADMLGDLSHGIVRVSDGDEPMGVRVWTLASNFFNCPVLPLAAVGGTLLCGRRSWFAPLAVALLAIVLSDPYAYRAVYAVPYCAYGFALAADGWCRERSTLMGWKNPLIWLTALLLVWSGGISIGLRTAIAAVEWEQRDPELALRLVDDLRAGAERRVLLDSWSLYYAVRSGGWAYWGPYDQRTHQEVARELDYDYVIHDESAGVHPLDAILRERGYRRDVVHVGPREPSSFAFLTNATARYGPYVVYTHPSMPVGGDSGGR